MQAAGRRLFAAPGYPCLCEQTQLNCCSSPELLPCRVQKNDEVGPHHSLSAALMKTNQTYIRALVALPPQQIYFYIPKQWIKSGARGHLG